MRIIGFAGWSGAGKTTLIVKLIPLLRADGLRVATVKRAHHGFDVDTPGKDSYAHRKAGAGEVLVASAARWALIHENEAPREPDLGDLLDRLSAADIVLVEGFKWDRLPKVEIHRTANGKRYLYPDDRDVVAVLSDGPVPAGAPSHAGLDDVAAARSFVVAHAVPRARFGR